ncbi:hypothetical protein HK405_005102 [Cladochytrium tenue]|nr:hypothetical protein HK405_005102 [Cladochytrium tenue]
MQATPSAAGPSAGDLACLVRAHVAAGDAGAALQTADALWAAGALRGGAPAAAFGACLEASAAAADAGSAAMWWSRMAAARRAGMGDGGGGGDALRLQFLVEAFLRTGDVVRAEGLLWAALEGRLLVEDRAFHHDDATDCLASALGEAESGRLASSAAEREPSVQGTVISPMLFTFNRVLEEWCKRGDLVAAVKLYNKMLNHAIKPDVWTYTFLLHAFASKKDMVNVERVYRRMLFMDITPDRVFYTVLISAYLLHGDIPKAHDLLRKLREDGIDDDDILLNMLIDRLGKNGFRDEAARLLKHRADASLNDFGNTRRHEQTECPSVRTYTSLINSYANIGDTRAALAWWNEMVYSVRIVPDATAFTAMIHAHARAGDPAGAAGWFERLRAAGCTPTLHSYTAVIAACAAGGDMAGAEAWLARLAEEGGLTPDAAALNVLAKGHAAAGDLNAARAALSRMRAAGCPPSEATFGALVRACTRRGHLAAAVALFREMPRAGLRPSVGTHTVLLAALCHEPTLLDGRGVRVKARGAGGLQAAERRTLHEGSNPVEDDDATDPDEETKAVAGGAGSGAFPARVRDYEVDGATSEADKWDQRSHLLQRHGGDSVLYPKNRLKFRHHAAILEVYASLRATLRANRLAAATASHPTTKEMTTAPPIEAYDSMVAYHARHLSVRGVQRVFLHALVDGCVPDVSLVIRVALAHLRGPYGDNTASRSRRQDARTPWRRLLDWSARALEVVDAAIAAAATSTGPATATTAVADDDAASPASDDDDAGASVLADPSDPWLPVPNDVVDDNVDVAVEADDSAGRPPRPAAVFAPPLAALLRLRQDLEDVVLAAYPQYGALPPPPPPAAAGGGGDPVPAELRARARLLRFRPRSRLFYIAQPWRPSERAARRLWHLAAECAAAAAATGKPRRLPPPLAAAVTAAAAAAAADSTGDGLPHLWEASATAAQSGGGAALAHLATWRGRRSCGDNGGEAADFAAFAALLAGRCEQAGFARLRGELGALFAVEGVRLDDAGGELRAWLRRHGR